MTVNAPGVPWIRLNAATSQDARLIRGGFWATAAWPAIIQMAKLHGWRGGHIPKDEFDAKLLAHHMNASVTDHVVIQGLEGGIAALVDCGLIEPNGAYLDIRSWAKYQSDPSNAERQSRDRERKREKKPVTLSALRNGSNGDVTGRDVTGRDVHEKATTPLPPAVAGGSGSSSSSSNGRPVSVSDRAVTRAILTAQAATPQGACDPEAYPEPVKKAWKLRQSLDAGGWTDGDVRAFLRDNEQHYRETATRVRGDIRRDARNSRRSAGDADAD